MLWVVAVTWPLLTGKSRAWGHPCEAGGEPSPSWQPGPCLAMQEQAGTEPSHRPHCPAVVCTGLIPALPSGGIIKGDEGTAWGGLVPPASTEPVGFLLPTCQRALTSLRGTGGQQDQGDKYLSGSFALPGRTGVEGHSCCGCQRAPISSWEEMGAARAPTSHPGGCAWSQPIMSPWVLPAPRALPDPCPHTARPGRSPAHTPAAS